MNLDITFTSPGCENSPMLYSLLEKITFSQGGIMKEKSVCAGIWVHKRWQYTQTFSGKIGSTDANGCRERELYSLSAWVHSRNTTGIYVNTSKMDAIGTSRSPGLRKAVLWVYNISSSDSYTLRGEGGNLGKRRTSTI